jgi:hypothetical protein
MTVRNSYYAGPAVRGTVWVSDATVHTSTERWMIHAGGARLDRAMVETLRPRFRRMLVRPGEEGYEEVRRVWNDAIDRHPALIARCAGAADVVEAVASRATASCSSPCGAGPPSQATRSATAVS